MTDKELHKLKRTELLEVLLDMRMEFDKITAENEDLKKKLEIAENNREILEKILYAVCPEEQKKES